MRKPRICVTITSNNPRAIKEVEPLVDMFEVRIDLIGDAWQEIVGQLGKPWIACNRSAAEGGSWHGNEARRIEKLLQATELGAEIVDIELRTKNLKKIVELIKRKTRCLLSFHDLEKTPPFDTMKQIIQEQSKAGADICKIVTTARSFEDNLSALQLIPEFPNLKLVAFTMGPLGIMSRVLCPLIGGEFTYASVARGKESAPGQITVKELTRVYGMITE
jgi:3-dehydroquinate dehydratase-1